MNEETKTVEVNDYMYRVGRLGFRPKGTHRTSILRATDKNGKVWTRLWWRFYWRRG